MNRELNVVKLHQINPRLIEEMNIPQRLAESVGYIEYSQYVPLLIDDILTDV